ncbi:unnamed protein product [Prorocentrum cordatum]|uniref:Uncharacterized protein n=1 Tax=Prorocentrum cordatum TaxID=2364126 RepID=A0ABN9UFX5_9DINO|nr:unnamed protein product [Polarella glacialis]
MGGATAVQQILRGIAATNGRLDTVDTDLIGTRAMKECLEELAGKLARVQDSIISHPTATEEALAKFAQNGVIFKLQEGVDTANKQFMDIASSDARSTTSGTSAVWNSVGLSTNRSLTAVCAGPKAIHVDDEIDSSFCRVYMGGSPPSPRQSRVRSVRDAQATGVNRDRHIVFS